MRWVLPDHIQDALPSDAHQLETLRRRLLDAFRVRGYQLVMPPLLEYLDSLTTGAGRDLALRTFTLVDQLSGRTMGVRADMTPQVARLDAHCLPVDGPARYCYAGTILNTRPVGLAASRYRVSQGLSMGRAGRIEVQQLGDEVWIGGAAVTCIEGKFLAG